MEQDDIDSFHAYVTMGELALAAMQLTSLRVTLATSVLYEKLQSRLEGFTPYDLLRDSIIRGFPCIIHHLDHFYVVYGFSDMRKIYYLKDSRPTGRRIISHRNFHSMWRRDLFEGMYDDIVDTAYSLLIIRPKIESVDSLDCGVTQTTQQ